MNNHLVIRARAAVAKTLNRHLTMDEHRVMPKTVAAAFRHLRVYDYFCLASRSAFVTNEENVARLLARFSPADRKEIANVPVQFLGDRAYVRKVGKGYPINRDWRPNCEYFIGMRIRFGETR